MEKVIYKKVTIAIVENDDKVLIQCIHLKGDEKLETGDTVTVRGELRRRNDVLEFSNGCTFIKAEEAAAEQTGVVDNLRNMAEGQLYADGFTALTGSVTVIEKVPNDKPQKITHYVGALTMFVVGVLYMLLSDLTFNNTADRLIISTLLSFGSAIVFFLSANYADRRILTFILKVLGILLGIGFVVYIHYFQNTEYFLGVLEDFRKKGISGQSDLVTSQLTIILTLVLGYISLAGMIANTVLVAVIKED